MLYIITAKCYGRTMQKLLQGIIPDQPLTSPNLSKKGLEMIRLGKRNGTMTLWISAIKNIHGLRFDQVIPTLRGSTHMATCRESISPRAKSHVREHILFGRRKAATLEVGMDYICVLCKV
jgi:hypothetical protein